MQCPHCNVALPSDARFCAGCGQAIPGARGPAASSSSTWVIVLVVCVGALGMVAVVGIIAAIAVPNFLNAVDRAKQKRTIADLRSIATAMEAYAGEHGTYPVTDDLEALRSQLQPRYIRNFPMRDGWGHACEVASEETTYELVSPGKDGVLDGCGGGETTDVNADICLSDGQFTQWPKDLPVTRTEPARAVGYYPATR